MTLKYNPFTGKFDFLAGAITDVVANLTIWAGKFDKNYIVASEASPTTGNITFDFVEGAVGSKVVIFHNSASVPTFPSQSRFVIGLYIPNLVNRIELNYDVANAIVNVTISQPSPIDIPDIRKGYSFIAQTSPATGIGFGTGTTEIAGSVSLGIIERLTVGSGQSRTRSIVNSNILEANSCNWVIDQKFKTPIALSDSSERYVLFVGTSNTGTNPHSASFRCAIIYSDDINTGKFSLQLGNSDVFDTGVVVQADTEYHVIIQHRVIGGISVWINGDFIGNFSNANVPSTVARPMYQLLKTVGTGTITADFGSQNFGVYDY